MTQFKIIFISLILSISFLFANSQELVVTNDLGAWLSAGFEKKIHKKLNLEFNQQVRLFKNFTKIDDIITNITFSYRIDDNFSLAAGGRYTYNLDYFDNLQHDFRYNLDFAYRYRFSSAFRFKYRLRFQNEYVNSFANSEFDKLQEAKFRNRLKLEYLHSQAHKLYLSAEIYKTYKIFRLPYFSKTIFFIGDKISFGKQSLDISLGFQRDLNKTRPSNFGVLVLKYNLKL